MVFQFKKHIFVFNFQSHWRIEAIVRIQLLHKAWNHYRLVLKSVFK